MNSTAAIKGFTGRHGGTVCTSSNAKRALDWAFEQGERVLFLPDQHLGRNTAVLEMGLSLDDCVVYDPHKPGGGLTAEQLRGREGDPLEGALLGARPVHRATRSTTSATGCPGSRCLCTRSASTRSSSAADLVGSTEYIIKTVEAAPAGSAWAIGTELNLVRRLANAHPDKTVVFLDKTVCFCSTMNRIDLPHLVWALEELVAGRVRTRSPSTRTPPATPGWPSTRCWPCVTVA